MDDNQMVVIELPHWQCAKLMGLDPGLDRALRKAEDRRISKYHEKPKEGNFPDIYDALAVLSEYITGHVAFMDGDKILDVRFVREEIHIVTYRGIWRLTPEDKNIELIMQT